ncbi:MAG: STN domain-containing protein [Planctomycetes bacterium]|nr:STN domain-containing protein [Planctomycetota bacterium]
MNATNEPLAQVVRALQQFCGVSIRIDDIEGQQLVSCRAQRIRLSDALDRLVKDGNLTWTIDRGTILITPRNEIGPRLITRS